GEILADDVKAASGGGATAATAAPAAPPPTAAFRPAPAAPATASGGPVEPLSSIGRLMAERTTQSWTTVPHFFVTREVNGTALVAVREKLGASIEQSRGVKLTYTDLLTAIVARVLTHHPRMNAS